MIVSFCRSDRQNECRAGFFVCTTGAATDICTLVTAKPSSFFSKSFRCHLAECRTLLSACSAVLRSDRSNDQSEAYVFRTDRTFLRPIALTGRSCVSRSQEITAVFAAPDLPANQWQTRVSAPLVQTSLHWDGLRCCASKPNVISRTAFNKRCRMSLFLRRIPDRSAARLCVC